MKERKEKKTKKKKNDRKEKEEQMNKRMRVSFDCNIEWQYEGHNYLILLILHCSAIHLTCPYVIPFIFFSFIFQ